MIEHRRLLTNKATARALSASSPTVTGFQVALAEHWHIYAIRFQSLGSPGMTASVLPGAPLPDAQLNAWPNNVGQRQEILWTSCVHEDDTGEWYTQDVPRLYFPPGSTFQVVTEYFGVNPGSDWTWSARYVATTEPLTNW